MKTIEICGKEYPIDCNAFTRFQYKTVFGKGIFADIKILNDFSEKQENLRRQLEGQDLAEEEIEKKVNSMMLENIDDFIDVIQKIAYILIYTANPKIGAFTDWLKGIDKIELSASWIGEVAEYAVNSFC